LIIIANGSTTALDKSKILYSNIHSNHWMFIAFIFIFDIYLMLIIIISVVYMDLTLTHKIIYSQTEDAQSYIPKFMAGHLPLRTMQDLYLITLLTTMGLAVVFFVSVTSLIKLQIPFLIGADRGPRQRACTKDYRTDNN